MITSGYVALPLFWNLVAASGPLGTVARRVIRSDPRPVTLKGIARPVEVVTIEWRT
jgi:hypothetical protein